MPRKAAPLAVRAFAEALPRLPADTRLFMAGDGADMPKVEDLHRELRLGDRLVLLGRIPTSEVRSHLASSRALVFTSLRDTFGGVVLEAAEVGARPSQRCTQGWTASVAGCPGRLCGAVTRTAFGG